MSNTALHTDKAPAAIGPYSQGIQAGNTIYVSGQIPIDPATGEFAGQDIKTQTRQSLTNISNILAAAGASMADVVKTTVLLNDIADFAAMNEVYAEFFTEPYPARAAFQAAGIPKGRTGRDRVRGREGPDNEPEATKLRPCEKKSVGKIYAFVLTTAFVLW